MKFSKGGAMDDLGNFNKAQEVALEHAWEWFSLHARQRMQSLYYFLIAAAFLFGALTHASNTNNTALALGVSLLGGAISYIFFRLENRVRNLLHRSEDVLKPLEDELAKKTRLPEIKIVSRADSVLPGSWAYSKVFRFLYAATGIAFGLFSLYFIWNLASEVPIYKNAFYLSIQFVIGIFLCILGFELLQSKKLEIIDKGIRNVRLKTCIVMGILILLIALCILIHLVFWRLTYVI